MLLKDLHTNKVSLKRMAPTTYKWHPKYDHIIRRESFVWTESL